MNGWTLKKRFLFFFFARVKKVVDLGKNMDGALPAKKIISEIRKDIKKLFFCDMYKMTFVTTFINVIFYGL